MKIGSFWGLPVPMIVCLDKQFPGKFDMVRFSNILDSSLNSTLYQDINKEFNFLRQRLELTKSVEKSLLISEEIETALKQCRTVKVSKGTLYGDLKGYSEEELLRYVTISFMCNLADSILLSELNDVGTSIDGTRASLLSVSKEYLDSNDFAIASIPVKARLLAKKLEGSNFVSSVIKSELEYAKTYFPVRRSTGARASDSAVKVFSWFVNQLDRIEELHAQINKTTREELKVFNTQFSVLIGRKPGYMKYSVVRDFDTLKSTRSKASITAFINNYKDQVEKYQNLLHTNITTSTGPNSENNYSIKELKMSSKHNNLILKAVDLNYLNPIDLLRADLDSLSDLADLVSEIDLNNLFGFTYTEEEWEELIEELCDIGICGINLHSSELFVESIDSVVFTMMGSKIVDDPEYYQERLNILEDIKSLIRSIKPIGERL